MLVIDNLTSSYITTVGDTQLKPMFKFLGCLRAVHEEYSLRCTPKAAHGPLWNLISGLGSTSLCHKTCSSTQAECKASAWACENVPGSQHSYLGNCPSPARLLQKQMLEWSPNCRSGRRGTKGPRSLGQSLPCLPTPELDWVCVYRWLTNTSWQMLMETGRVVLKTPV